MACFAIDRCQSDIGVTMFILPSSTLSSKYGRFWLQKTKIAVATVPNPRLQNGSP